MAVSRVLIGVMVMISGHAATLRSLRLLAETYDARGAIRSTLLPPGIFCAGGDLSLQPGTSHVQGYGASVPYASDVPVSVTGCRPVGCVRAC